MESSKKFTADTQISKDKIKKIWTETFSKNPQERKMPLPGYIVASFLTNLVIITLVLALVYTKRIQPEVPLFYGSPEGEEQLAASWMLAIPAIIASAFTIVNTTLSYFLKDDFLKKSLIIGAFTLTVLSTITTLKIIGLISSL